MARGLSFDDRRERLAEAVWQVILERGISAVSIRTVAEQAGVATGSLRHVFPTRSELINYSAELMIQRATTRALNRTRAAGEVSGLLDLIAEFMPFDQQRRAELEVNLALIAESLAEPGLVEIRNNAHEQLRQLCIKIVIELSAQTLSAEENLRHARRLHALMDGVAVHLLHQEADSETDWALEIMREELALIAAQRA